MNIYNLHFEASDSAVIGGQAVPYRAISESFPLGGTEDAPEATIFSFTYLRTDVSIEARRARPVIFAFNGGPGSSCIWLHLGLMGPTRVKLDDPINPDIAPPHLLEDNPHSPLSVADVVMIDPVGTGYARLLNDAAASKYYGIEQDAAAVARFIEHWLTRHDRWQSPKYLLGESYGTLRCGVLAEALMGGPTTGEGRVLGIAVDGVLLLGSAMLGGREPERVEPSVLALPTWAATRYYHRPEPGISLEGFVEEARAFGAGEYLTALYGGGRLPETQYESTLTRLAYFSGMSSEYLREHGLRVESSDFLEMICAARGRDVGLYDSRYTVPHQPGRGLHDTIADDAAMGLYVPPYVGAMNGAKKAELGIETELDYRVITLKDVNFRWDFTAPRTALQCLTAAMRRNKDMRLFFGTGRFDLVTTIEYARYMASRGTLPQNRVVIAEYNSGHMPYLGEESASALGRDIREFVTGGVHHE